MRQKDPVLKSKIFLLKIKSGSQFWFFWFKPNPASTGSLKPLKKIKDEAKEHIVNFLSRIQIPQIYTDHPAQY